MPRAILIGGGVAVLLAALLLGHPFGGAPVVARDKPAPLVTGGNTPPPAGKASPTVTAVPADPPVVSPKDQWLDALTRLEFEPFDQAAPLLRQALQCPDRDVRVRAVNLLVANKDNSAILPLLALAQGDADAEVRRSAVAALAYSPFIENLTPWLLRGAADMDDGVREEAMRTAWSLAPGQRDDFIAQSLNASRPEVVSAAFQMLAHESSPKTVMLLLAAYGTNDATRIQQANDVMSGLVGQTFDNAVQAAAWWRDHQADYNDDLSLKIAE